MSYVGVFRKLDLDGASNLVYTTGSSSSSSVEALTVESGGKEPLFFCPRARIQFQEFKIKLDGEDDELMGPLYQLNSSPFYQEGESLPDDICKLPLVPLFWCNNKIGVKDEFTCGSCKTQWQSISYYACLHCQQKFHKECVESPSEIKHPSHPFHSLKLSMYDGVFLSVFYSCVTCRLKMYPIEAMSPIPFVIDHPKSHHHPLTFFPTQASLVCHICGQIRNLDPTYICIQCVFVIHKGCINFPHVIRISRHHHRLSFTSSLPPEKLPCRVCHKDVDNNYGAYSCSKCDAYFVHSRCALHKNVWDGIYLDEVPEEDDMIDDGEPFERISDGIILHPSHIHNLRGEISEVYDENKLCEGCSLPFYEGKYYICIECNFVLHESCAHAPRMIRHPLHPHPLTMDFAPKGVFFCNVCNRDASGFFYEHQTRDKIIRYSQLREQRIGKIFSH